MPDSRPRLRARMCLDRAWRPLLPPSPRGISPAGDGQRQRLTVWTAYFLRRFRRSRRFLEPTLRRRLGLAIHILLRACLNVHEVWVYLKLRYYTDVPADCHQHSPPDIQKGYG